MADTETSTERTRRVAKLKRDLAELRGRMTRIDHETFSARRELAEIETELLGLAGGAA